MNTQRIGFTLVVTGILLLFNVGCVPGPETTSNEIELTNTPRSKILFDFDWLFHRGDIVGGEIVEIDDTPWRTIDLPHDWSIEDIPGTDSPLDSNAIGGISMGYYVGGTGWYRKKFTVPEDLSDKKFRLLFEGIYMNADIWLNGQHLGNHPYGYTSFWIDLTDHIHFGEENILAVQVKNEGKNSRWYSGSGIYRHVWLLVTEPLHIAPWGVYITTPEVTGSSAKVGVKIKVMNDREEPFDMVLSTKILNPSGNKVAGGSTNQNIEANSFSEVTQELTIESPELWSPDSPVLYTAITEIMDSDAEVLDVCETTFGIRTIEFTVEEGFLLNGVPTLLKGGCMHHDNGPLGSAAFNRAEERRVELMKASGFNAIRCAHNPPSPAFLNACDRLGILVIDESFDHWIYGKNPQDYSNYFENWWQRDTESMIVRDRNHPSIIMWSIGNEIPGMDNPEIVEWAKKQADYVRELDPTRPVTAAVNNLNPQKDPYFAALDVQGYNYPVGGDHRESSLYEKDHKRIPDRIMYCSESYPLEAFGAWMAVVKLPYVFGDFVWTGFDYLGEASIGWLGYPHEGSFYPWNHAFCGDIDICGFKRPQSYYRNVLWNAGRQISIFVKPPTPSFEENPDRRDWSKWHWYDVVADWNWAGNENIPLEVVVYCSYDKAELLLNGESLGVKETTKETQWTAAWQVPYQPGTLRAVAYSRTEEVDSWELASAGKPTKIRLTADRTLLTADGQDLCYITVELLDSNGILSPKAENEITIEIEGPGEVIAVASSNPMSTESYQQKKRKAYKGRCLIVVKSTRKAGDIRIVVHAEGLQQDALLIKSET